MGKKVAFILRRDRCRHMQVFLGECLNFGTLRTVIDRMAQDGSGTGIIDFSFCDAVGGCLRPLDASVDPQKGADMAQLPRRKAAIRQNEKQKCSSKMLILGIYKRFKADA